MIQKKIETRGRPKKSEKGVKIISVSIPLELYESPEIQQLVKNYQLSKLVVEFLQNRSK